MPHIGRFVTLQTRGTQSFSVTELQVTAANMKLVSYNKPCTISSVYSPYVCANAFNGNFDDFAHSESLRALRCGAVRCGVVRCGAVGACT